LEGPEVVVACASSSRAPGDLLETSFEELLRRDLFRGGVLAVGEAEEKVASQRISIGTGAA
jgi:hypothetical protein